jgi:hypothetical protein
MIRLYSHLRWPDYSGITWFNLGLGGFGFSLLRSPLYINKPVWFYNCFVRFCADGMKQAGFGLLQIGSRHLAYVGLTNQPESRCGRLSLSFLFMNAEFFCEPGEQP